MQREQDEKQKLIKKENNMNRAILSISLLFGLTGLGYGIYYFVNEQKKLLKSYCFKIKNVLIKRLKSDDIGLVIVMLLKNQSDVDVTITKMDLDVFMDGKKVADVLDDDMSINWASRQVSEVRFEVAFNPQIVFKSLGNAINLVTRVLTNPDNILINVKGKVSAEHSFIKIADVPIDYTMTLSEIGQESENEDTYKCEID